MNTNTYEKHSGIISDMDIEKRLLQMKQDNPEEAASNLGSPDIVYGSELPFYFLYTDGAGAEGVKQSHVRLLDMTLNNETPGKAYLQGTIALKLDVPGFYIMLHGVEVCVIQAETPDEERHHALVLRHEIAKVYTILHEMNEVGKEITIMFHVDPPSLEN